LLCWCVVPNSRKYLVMHVGSVCKQAQSSSWLATVTVTIARPFRAHHTIALALPSSLCVRVQRHAPRTPLCWLMERVWQRNGGTDTPMLHAPRPNKPSIPVGGLSPLVSRPLFSHESHCPHCPSPRPEHSRGILDTARVLSLMLRESPQPVTVKAALASWLAE
jgi:hypothetical protein